MGLVVYLTPGFALCSLEYEQILDLAVRRIEGVELRSPNQLYVTGQ